MLRIIYFEYNHLGSNPVLSWYQGYLSGCKDKGTQHIVTHIKVSYLLLRLQMASPGLRLQVCGIYGMHKRHLHSTSLSVFIFLDPNPNRHFITDCYRLFADGDDIVFRVELHVLLERHESFNAQSIPLLHVEYIRKDDQGGAYFETNTPTPFLNVRMTNASSVTSAASPIVRFSFSPRPFSARPT